ncbi:MULTISPECIES: hypothetical protein [unclassified Streptomyces]
MNPTHDFTGQAALATGSASGMGPPTARSGAALPVDGGFTTH